MVRYLELPADDSKEWYNSISLFDKNDCDYDGIVFLNDNGNKQEILLSEFKNEYVLESD